MRGTFAVGCAWNRLNERFVQRRYTFCTSNKSAPITGMESRTSAWRRKQNKQNV